MYIAPGFDLISCEPVDEASFHHWVVAGGGIRRLHPARVAWAFGPQEALEATLKTLTEADKNEWTPLLHSPPQGVIEVTLCDNLFDTQEAYVPLLDSLFKRWDGYAWDFGTPEWVSELLRSILPAKRIIRYEPPPLSAGPAWIWVNGRYTRNEAYYDNRDADNTHDKTQL